MKLLINNLSYARGKDVIPMTEPQALLLVGDLIAAALSQGGFSCDLGIVEESDEQPKKE